MKIEVVLTEAEIVQELAEAVESRDLPEKFFYWSPLAVRTWLALAADPAFDGIRSCWKQLAARLDSLLAPFPAAVPVISLGAGDGATDRLLLDPVTQSGRNLRYFPVDASQALLEMACAGAEDLDMEPWGIKADISSAMHLVFASDAAESPKLLTMSGNTIGGFDPLGQIRQLAECMHSGDRLALDAELYRSGGESPPEEESLRQFAFAPLAALGVSADQGEVRFEHKRDERLAGLNLTRAVFRPTRDLCIGITGREVLVERAEQITMNLRYSFTREAFHSVLVHAGLQILEEIPSPDGRYLLAVCAR
jgi:Histidine-specific methyltransferase, SAM-dependent